jgi:uncharacterized protein YchJ
MTLNRQILRKIDDRLRSESDQETGEWMAKVPISGATKAVWQRYCQAVGVHMGQAVAFLIHNELASIVDEDVETLADRLKAQVAAMEARARALKDREKELRQRDRVLFLREADLEDREKEVAAREHNVAVLEHNLAQQLMRGAKVQPASASSRPKPGRNEPCPCGSGKKYKHCHLPLDG